MKKIKPIILSINLQLDKWIDSFLISTYVWFGQKRTHFANRPEEVTRIRRKKNPDILGYLKRNFLQLYYCTSFSKSK